MLRKPVFACFFFLLLSVSVSVPLQAQNPRVTEAGMAFGDQNYEETIDLARKALEKPELLNAKNMAKAHALLAQSYVILYSKYEKAPADAGKNPDAKKNWEAKKAKFDSKYPTALDDAKASLDFISKSPEGASYEKEVANTRLSLAQIYLGKLQDLVSTSSKDYNAQFKYANTAEDILKNAKNAPPLFLIILHYLRGTAHYSQSIDNSNNESMDRAALADFKKTIELSKTAKFAPKEENDIKTTISGAYANAIGISTRVDKAGLKALIDEAKAKFPGDKSIEEMSLQAQVSTGSTDESERAMYDAIQKDPKNEQKLLVYASLLEKKYDAGLKAKKSEAELEEAYNKVVKAYQDVLAVNPQREEANFNLGAIMYNRAVEVNKQINELPDDAPDSKLNALQKKKKDFMRSALPLFEMAAQKNNYKDDSSLSTLITITMELEMPDKTAFYNEKKKALKK